MYAENTRAVRFATTKELMTLRLREGALVHENLIKMMTLVEKLANLDVVLSAELSLDIISPKLIRELHCQFQHQQIGPSYRGIGQYVEDL